MRSSPIRAPRWLISENIVSAAPSSATLVVSRLTRGSAGSSPSARHLFAVAHAACQRIGVFVDTAAVRIEQAERKLGVAYLIPCLARHGQDQLRRHAPILPLDDFTAEGVDAGELGASDGADERLAELDVCWIGLGEIAQGLDIVVRGVAELFSKRGTLFVRKGCQRTIRRLAHRLAVANLAGERGKLRHGSGSPATDAVSS